MQQDFATSNFTAQSDTTTSSSVHSKLRVDMPLAYLHRPAKWQAGQARQLKVQNSKGLRHHMSRLTPQVALPLHVFAKQWTW